MTIEKTFDITVAPDPRAVAGADGEAGKKACYIATAAYGSYLDTNVRVLREFRDERLMTSSAGRLLVDLYYRVSPPVADFIAGRPALKLAVRVALTPVVYTMKYPIAGLAFVAGAAAAGGALRRRRGRARR